MSLSIPGTGAVALPSDSTVAANPATGNRSSKIATMQKFADEFAALKSTNGYQKLPSGLIIQWGVTAGINNSSGVNVIFPIPFPTACFVVNATHQAPGSGPGSRIVEVVIRSTTYFDAYGNTTANAIYWIAIGH